MKKINGREIWSVLRQAAKGISEHKIFKMSASLAYYTIFSLGPMLLVIIFLGNVFLKKEAFEGSLYKQAGGLIGPAAASQIQEIIKNAALSGHNSITAVIGFITLLIGATTVFSDIQDSINSIWNLKIKPSKDNFIKMLLSRLLSFSVVIGMGFLLLVSMAINGLLDVLMDRLKDHFPDMAVVIAYTLNIFLTLVITSFLFAIIFKVLPDALIKWKDVMIGALFTAILFMAGKFLISFYIGSTDVGSSYGAAGSIVVLMLWVYFTAFILYLGAEFTKAWALKFGGNIRPNKYAVTMQVAEVETKEKTVQANENKTETTKIEMQQQADNKI
ncbi:MAG: YihY/virulence factor BrkB family protein [Ferruginibacter sp.]